jgi:hypothetical protein
MTMAPYQQRVIDEKRELDARTRKLSVFIESSAQFIMLDVAEQERMRKQCELMCEYSKTLGERIEAFPS